MTSSDSINSLLLALGLSTSKPTPPSFKFSKPNPMSADVLISTESDINERNETEIKWYKLSSNCNTLVSQINLLRNRSECIIATNRMLTAIQTQSARHIVLELMSKLSNIEPAAYQYVMETLQLDNVQHLIRLLRLVQAQRIGLPVTGSEKYIKSAISTLCSQGGVASMSLLKVQ